MNHGGVASRGPPAIERKPQRADPTPGRRLPETARQDSRSSVGRTPGRRICRRSPTCFPRTAPQAGTHVMARILTSRVDRLLSSMGYGSRNEMARLAKAGGITLDAAAVRDVTRRIPVTPDLPSRMTLDGEPLDPLAGMVILLNKPLGVTCSHKDDGKLVYDILPERWKRRDPPISAIGRLDKQTSGLLLLTDDGDLLHRVISPRRHVKKTYRVKLARPLDGTEADVFASGQLMLDGEDKPLAPAELTVHSATEALLDVTEGRYHQVRRMFAATGNHVEELHRERVGGLSLPDGMAPGQWKLLSEEEIRLIFQ